MARTKTDIKTPKKIKDRELFWVGVGASAGGLEALKDFVVHLKKGNGMTFIIAQHLSPHHKSMLVDLIARETTLSVVEVTDGVTPQADTIYITPSKHEVLAKAGRLFLSDSTNKLGPKPSINFFFSSLAEEKENHAIGVILSGSGSDGAHGIRAIRAAGGITMAQDEDTAKYFSMPDAAIKTECVDIVLPPHKIAETLPRIINTPRNKAALYTENQSGDILQNLYRLLKRFSGVDFSEYKPGTIGRRIERRMVAKSIHDIEDYFKLLQNEKDEIDVLFKDLLISVTSFFRDRKEFEALQKYCRQIIAKSDAQNIRIWVPGCATGEEAYSIAIMFAEEMGLDRFINSKFVIFATDIDEAGLNIARKGNYPLEAYTSLPENIAEKYFDIQADHCVVKKFLKTKIVFSRHNLISEPPFSKINLVSCRNLLIYFNNNLQSKVLQILHYSLAMEGILFLGRSESLGEAEEYFAPIEKKAKIFMKKFLRDTSLANYTSVLKTRFQSMHKEEKPASADASLQSISEKLVSVMAPNSILYDEKLNIRHVYGDIKQFVDIAPGALSINLMNILDKTIAQEIHALTHKSLNENIVIRGNPKSWVTNEKPYKIQISVFPVFTDLEFEKLFLATFALSPSDLTNVASNPEEDSKLVILEQELASTREYLQTVVEELETSNEELQSLNEELQSANEELQSANEELETSNEELQSTNEELSTVNDEIQIKSSELEEMNDYLANIKDSTDIATILVNKDLNIALINKAAESIFAGNTEGVIGQNITFQNLTCSIPDLRNKILNVIKSKIPFSENITSDESFLIMKITPFIRQGGEATGAVLSFINSREDLQRYALILSQNKEGIWDWQDTQKDIVYFSPKAKKILGYGATDEIFFSDFIGKIHPSELEDLNKKLGEHIKSQKPFDLEYLYNVNDNYKWIRIRGCASKDSNSNKTRIIGSVSDIDNHKKTSLKLHSSELALQTYIDASYDGFWDWHIKDNYEYMSPRFWEMFGYDPKTKKHCPSEWQKIIAPDSLKLALENFDKHVKTKGKYPYSQEVEYIHKDGSSVYVICRGKIIEWDKDGSPLRMIGTHTDITDIKRTQESLKESEQLHELVLKATRDGIWDWPNIEEDEEYWSETWYELLGYKPGEIKASASTFFKMLHPDDIEFTKRAAEQATKGEAPFDVEYRLKTKSGNYKWFRAKGIVSENEETGIKRMTGSITDIDSQKKVQTALENSEVGRQGFIQASHDGYWDWHIKDNYEYMSPRFWTMFGYDPATKRHDPSEWKDIINKDDLKVAQDNFDKHVKTKGKHPYSQEIRYLNKDGSTTTVLSRGSVVEWDAKDGSAVRMIGTHTDLTELRKTEERLKKYADANICNKHEECKDFVPKQPKSTSVKKKKGKE